MEGTFTPRKNHQTLVARQKNSGRTHPHRERGRHRMQYFVRSTFAWTYLTSMDCSTFLIFISTSMIYLYHLLRAMNANNFRHIDFTPTLQSTQKIRDKIVPVLSKKKRRKQIENFNWRTHTNIHLSYSIQFILTLSLSLSLCRKVWFMCLAWWSRDFGPVCAAFFSLCQPSFLHSNQSSCEWAINFVDGGSGKAENLSFIKIICSFWGFVKCFAVLVLQNSEAWKPHDVWYVWSREKNCCTTFCAH